MKTLLLLLRGLELKLRLLAQVGSSQLHRQYQSALADFRYQPEINFKALEQMNLRLRHQRRYLVPWLALLLLAALVSYRQVAAQFTAAAAEPVAGSYAGTVLVSEPALLGDLDLQLDITATNGQLAGQVNAAKTQVFLGGPTFTGSVTTNGVITPTLRIESQSFSSVVSGRTVQRHFVLTGEVLNGGNTLRGTYAETIIGFKPHPMQVKGSFRLARPDGVTAIVTVPTPQGSTLTPTPGTPGPGNPPTATPTATPTTSPTVPSSSDNGVKIYLPIVQQSAVLNAAAVEVTMSATPTPTPMVAASSVLTTTDTQQQILLPLIMR
ncbi:MAG: hypothetical protein KDE31_03060 [Caldilineaceae bacterium]|nr:hypothetical protein [Caldilineaceae bacterium]